jgi:hypothetical protein
MNSRLEYIEEVGQLQKKYQCNQVKILAIEKEFHELNQHFREGKNVVEFPPGKSNWVSNLTADLEDSNIFEAVPVNGREIELLSDQQQQLCPNHSLQIMSGMVEPHLFPSTPTYYPMIMGQHPHIQSMRSYNSIPIQSNYFKIPAVMPEYKFLF